VNVIDLAGGPLAGVMKSSEEHSVRRDWDRGCQSLDLNNRQFYRAFARCLSALDPVKLARTSASDQVLDADRTLRPFRPNPVPAQTLEALGKPARRFRIRWPLHLSLALPAHRGTIMKFFNKTSKPSPRPPNQDSTVLAMQAK